MKLASPFTVPATFAFDLCDREEEVLLEGTSGRGLMAICLVVTGGGAMVWVVTMGVVTERTLLWMFRP